MNHHCESEKDPGVKSLSLDATVLSENKSFNCLQCSQCSKAKTQRLHGEFCKFFARSAILNEKSDYHRNERLHCWLFDVQRSSLFPWWIELQSPRCRLPFLIVIDHCPPSPIAATALIDVRIMIRVLPRQLHGVSRGLVKTFYQNLSNGKHKTVRPCQLTHHPQVSLKFYTANLLGVYRSNFSTWNRVSYQFERYLKLTGDPGDWPVCSPLTVAVLRSSSRLKCEFAGSWHELHTTIVVYYDHYELHSMKIPTT